jgi:hypothetical protein
MPGLAAVARVDVTDAESPHIRFANGHGASTLTGCDPPVKLAVGVLIMHARNHAGDGKS